MDFHLLGVVEVVDDGRALPLGGTKQRALLALLALNAGRGVSPDRLIDELWGERPPATATKALQIHVSRLRRALAADVIHTRPDGYALVVAADHVDAVRFERLLAAAPHAPDVCAAVDQALALWRGPPLADLAHEPFARRHIVRLQELRLGALELRTEALLAQGRHDEVIAELEGLVEEEPYRERLRAQLMIALYRAGRQADALEAFQAARRTLLDDLGLEPGERLRELQRGILDQSPALAAPRFEPDPLPRALQAESPFVARETELARLSGLWAAVSRGGDASVFITGEAGIGKTRLAARFARAAHGATVLYGRCDEQLAVPFEPFVQALGELEGGDRRALFAAVAERLAERPTVLVLDDLQWADPPTLALLRYLVRARPPRTLILALHRDGALDDLWAQERTERLVLVGLDARAVATLLPTPDAGLADRLVAETAGNPFFVGELIAHGGDLAPPDTVRDVILARERRLSPGARSVLRTAAVIGTDFSVRVLERLHPGDELLDALDEAGASGLIAERGHGDYAFKHALVRRALYDDLAAIRRARLHARVGETLEAGGEATVQDLAHHFAEAADDGHGRRAANYAIAAGREAIRRGGYEQAVAHYRRGLRALDGGRAGRGSAAHRRRGLFARGRGDDAALRRELARLLRQTRYEPLPAPGAIPGWLWGKLSRGGRIAVSVSAVAVLALVAVGTPALVSAQHERSKAETARERRERAVTVASINAEQRPHAGHGRAAGIDPAARARLVAIVESRIQADATRRGDAVLRVECDPHRPGGEGTLDCLAVSADVAPTARSSAQAHGRPYRANVAFATGRFAYCRISPRATKLLRPDTPLPPACGEADAPRKVQGQPG